MSSDTLVLAQLGCGYWGPNLLRNFSALPNSHVKYTVDASAERRTFVRSNFPKTEAVESADTVFNDPAVKAVIVATPAASHFELARRALDSGKHVFVEKPLATRAAEFDELGALAAKHGLVVIVGHTCIYDSSGLLVRAAG